VSGPKFPEQLLQISEDEVEGRFYRWFAAEAGPDDWHRFALGGNWDMHDPEVFQWVAQQPDCDQATALTLFWKASPDYAVEFPNADYEHRSLIQLIRERWRSGEYRRQELAFVPEADAWLPDFESLKSVVGERVETELPESIRNALPGRRLDTDGDIEGIPSRFWPQELR
jgi:hypothetical protein